MNEHFVNNETQMFRCRLSYTPRATCPRSLGARATTSWCTCLIGCRRWRQPLVHSPPEGLFNRSYSFVRWRHHLYTPFRRIFLKISRKKYLSQCGIFCDPCWWIFLSFLVPVWNFRFEAKNYEVVLHSLQRHVVFSGWFMFVFVLTWVVLVAPPVVTPPNPQYFGSHEMSVKI